MCNACGFLCCGSDEFNGCGCESCDEPGCWPDDDDFFDEADDLYRLAPCCPPARAFACDAPETSRG